MISFRDQMNNLFLDPDKDLSFYLNKISCRLVTMQKTHVSFMKHFSINILINSFFYRNKCFQICFVS